MDVPVARGWAVGVGLRSRQASIAQAAIVARSSRDAPAVAASSRTRSVSSRIPPGSLRV
ncbi:MAG: hypothetical protein ACRDNO_15720 [Trebonia sp.]